MTAFDELAIATAVGTFFIVWLVWGVFPMRSRLDDQLRMLPEKKPGGAAAPAVLEGIAFAPRYIIGRTRITMVAQVLLAASLSFLTTPPPALLSLAAFSQRAASVVRSTTRQSICRRS